MYWIIPWGILALMSAAAADPKGDRLTSDLDAVHAAHADDVMVALARCAGERIQAYIPTTDEFGKTEPASELLKNALKSCGAKDAEMRVRTLLKEASPATSSVDIDRQVSTALAGPLLVLTIALNEKFRIPARPNPPEPPLTIPCPPGDQPQPDACRHK